jgi:hypothetical protein
VRNNSSDYVAQLGHRSIRYREEVDEGKKSWQTDLQSAQSGAGIGGVSLDLKKCISYRSRENRVGPDLKIGCRDEVRWIGLWRDRKYMGEK